MDQIMHICMALSDYDTIPACAAIQSLKDSRDQKDHYNIFLFTAGVTEEHEKWLECLQGRNCMKKMQGIVC